MVSAPIACSTRYRLGRRTKTLGEIWPFDHLDKASQSVLDGIDEVVLVTAIDNNRRDEGADLDQALDKGKTTILVLNINGSNIDSQQAPIYVNRDVTLASLDLFSSVIAPLPLRSIAFDQGRRMAY
jgi:hypothetical protein